MRINPLVLRDARNLRRRWKRSFFVLCTIATVIIQLTICLNYELIFGMKPRDEDLVLYFGFFHILIHLVVPVGAMFLPHSRLIKPIISECLMTPLRHRTIFWWLWTRVFLSSLSIILALYLPLLIPFDWLRHDEMYRDLLGDQSELITIHGRWWREGGANLILIGLAVLPFVRSAKIRFGFITAFAGLVIFQWWATWTDYQGDWTMLATHQHFHPAVTLLYFVVSITWSVGLGVGVGLSTPHLKTRHLFGVLMCVPLAEIAIGYTFAMGESVLLEPTYLLLYLLGLNIVSLGVFWLGLKWNLLMWLSRRRIRWLDQ